MKRQLAMLRRWWRTRRSPLGALIYEPLLDGPSLLPKKPEADTSLSGLWGTSGMLKTHVIVPSTLTQHYATVTTYCGRSLGPKLRKGLRLTEPGPQRLCVTCRKALNRVGVDYDPNGYLEPAGASA